MRTCKAPDCTTRLPPYKESNRHEQMGCCSDVCSYALFKQKQAEKAEKQRMALEAHRSACKPRKTDPVGEVEKAEKTARNRQNNAKKRELRRQDKRHQLKLTQSAFNAYIRARDYGRPCHSCGATPENKYGGTVDCSHYRSVGAAPHMRFYTLNAVSACVRCNRELSGNIVELRKGLIARFGVEKVEAIEADNTIRKYDIDYLERLRSILKRKTRMIKSRKGLH